MEKKLVKLSEAYDIIPYAIPTIRVYASKGKIPCYVVGRRIYCDLDEIKEYVKSITSKRGGKYAEQSESNQQSFK